MVRKALLLSWAELAQTPEEAMQILLDCARDIVYFSRRDSKSQTAQRLQRRSKNTYTL